MRPNVVVLALGLLLAACESPARREAASVVTAVELFRKAENPAKPAALATITATTCSAPDVCQARTACLAFAEPTAEAQRLQGEVAAGLRAMEAGTLAKDSGEAQALPEKLAKAEVLLGEGRRKLEACDEELVALRRRHRL